MNTDYAWIAVFLIAMVILVIWLIRRNRKDKIELEEDLIQSDLKPEKHDDEETMLTSECLFFSKTPLPGTPVSGVLLGITRKTMHRAILRKITLG